MDIYAGNKPQFPMPKLQGNAYVSESTHASELSKIVSQQVFEQAYEKFMEQAEKNVLSKKSHGSRTPYGFSAVPECDGAGFLQHFGQGAPSATPYMNWWVVSVYYLVDSGDIVLGIEEGRYPYLNDMQMKPTRFERVGKRKNRIAVYYSTKKEDLGYEILYEKFISICEEVMRLGVIDASTGALSNRNNSAGNFTKRINSTVSHHTTRSISQRLRYKVLSRDNFKCCACGASPAKDPSVELHVDHIVPWSKGGETTIDNLQTLCSKCNLGKSNLVLD